MASTQEAAKADKPALRAKPTTCTRGIEWQIQQKMLIKESDQKLSRRKTSPHNEPPDRAGLTHRATMGEAAPGPVRDSRQGPGPSRADDYE